MTDQPGKRLEVLLELKISDVMETNIVSIHPDAMMSELRTILREKRISGVPVVDRDTLVGIISVEDYITHLVAKEHDCPIRDRMNRNPVVMAPNQPLIQAVRRLDKTGFGRLPIVDEESRALVGILTRTDIIIGILKELESEFEEEEIRRYRASHIFGDIVADYEALHLRYSVEGLNMNTAGQASTHLKKNLRRLGVDPDVVRRVAIASYEAEMNLVIYGGGGIMDVTISPSQIHLVISDEGPGIEDVEEAMRPGYSTSENWVRELGFGAGMGLPNIKKCSDTMNIDSSPGVGTTLGLLFQRGKADEAA